MVLHMLFGALAVPARAVAFPYEDSEVQAYLEEAGEALREIAAEGEIPAAVYLCRSYTLRTAPGSESLSDIVLPSGLSVSILDAVMDDRGQVWVMVNALLQDQEVQGYIERDNLACSDERFLAWEDTYGMVPINASLWDLDRETETDVIEEEIDPGEEIPLDVLQFPESYHQGLLELKELHGNWTFVPMFTELDWNTVITSELQNSKSLVHRSFPDCTKEGQYDQGNWFYASREVLERYMDPRNSLTESAIFQFEQLTYNESYHTLEAMEAFLNGTFMNSSRNAPGTDMTFAFIFWAIGKEEGRKVSPFHLAARVYQEQGRGNSALISGTYPGYEGYYNYFNIGASGTTAQQIIENGLRYAKNATPPWNNAYYSILGGADVISANYIKKGQNTLYLQKYNVNKYGSYALYTHQYMQNISAPTTEAASIKRLYESAGALDSPFVFVIPVYENMPEEPCKMPTESTNVVLRIPDGYQGSTVYLDQVPYTGERRNGSLIVKAADAAARQAQVVLTDEGGNVNTRYLWDLEYKDTYYQATPWSAPLERQEFIVDIPQEYYGEELWLDGKKASSRQQDGRVIVKAPAEGADTAIAYRYTEAGVPTGMYVWSLEQKEYGLEAIPVPGLEGLLSYHGFSIRIVGKSGIRFKSGISAETREQLLGEGIDGYHLKEYGTLVMTNANRELYPMILGGTKVAKGLTYGTREDGEKVDTIYETVDGRYRFTGVLVGLPVEQYKTEFAFRGYAVMEKDGREVVLYSAPVARSIYALSQQVLGLGMYEEGSNADIFLKKLISDADALDAPEGEEKESGENTEERGTGDD